MIRKAVRRRLDSSGEPVGSGQVGGPGNLRLGSLSLRPKVSLGPAGDECPRGPGPEVRAGIVGLPAMELLPFAAILKQAARAANGVPAGASEVSISTLNSSGFSMTTVSPAGSPVTALSNLTVTVITGCPGDNRRLRAMDGCGGDISTLTAAAGRAFSTEPSEGAS